MPLLLLTLSGLSPSSVLVLFTFKSSLRNLWNFGLCLHVPKILLLWLMILSSSCCCAHRILILSLMHNKQLSFPNVFMQLIGLPCHRTLKFMIIFILPGVTCLPLGKWHAKCEVKVSDFLLLSIIALVSDWQWECSCALIRSCWWDSRSSQLNMGWTVWIWRHCQISPSFLQVLQHWWLNKQSTNMDRQQSSNTMSKLHTKESCPTIQIVPWCRYYGAYCQATYSVIFASQTWIG